jgi:hypothetical protein
LKKLVAALLLAALPSLSGCNAAAIALAAYAQPGLGTMTAKGNLQNAPSTAKIGYITWIELMRDGSVQGKLNFDLVRDKNVTFDKTANPSGPSFAIDLVPKAQVAEGTYVVFAWNDQNNNGIYEGDQGETRAPEVYRVRGQATSKGLWTTEKFVFTDKKLSIEYADANGGLSFTFP